MLIQSNSEPLRGVPYLVGKAGIAWRTEEKVRRAGRPLIWLPPRELTRHERDIERIIRREERRCSPVGPVYHGLGTRSYSAAAPVYSPLDEGNGVAWFDLQDTGAYTTSGGDVATVTNKVSTTVWSEASNRPAFNATRINGLPGLDFDAANSEKIISTEAAVFGALQDSPAYTMAYVGQFDVADSSHTLFGAGNSGFSANRTKRWGTNTGGTGQWAASTTDNAGAGVNGLSAASTSNTNAHIFLWHASGSAITLQVDNGTADPSGATHSVGTLTLNRCALGCRPDSAPDSFGDGGLGELLLYSVELDSSARGRIYTYLSDRWGF